ncbi:hypothetical protein J4E83_010550 [Alternaria metachromatica]|uniref:uncharacterized protein n=1 Tax=Alternaria metachromatica TaxID=283354 RepID=UPI0020C31B68|nr:uncharacterized protein J4E83_010550 [Alternaria metachromatica]KAI4605557.1 hypothetical protein J4E83_010550 [Alternaria metachromatica]
MAGALSLAASGGWFGNDGSWSTFLVHVGSPPQTFNVLPATQAANIWLPIADECMRLQNGSASCGNSRGVTPFQQRPSPGFQANMSSTWKTIGLYELGMGRIHEINGNGLQGFDSVELNDFTMEGQAITAYASPGFWIGQMGLSPLPLNFSETISSPSLMSALKDEGHIPSLSYGYQAGASYRKTRIPASLVLGGYDLSRSSEPLTVDINSDLSKALTVGLQDIIVTDSLNGTLSMVDNERILAPIDSSIPDMWLPKSVCDRFESAFGLEYHERSGSQYAIGRAFLQEAYIGVDFEAGTFNVSAAKWDDVKPEIVTISAHDALYSTPQLAGMAFHELPAKHGDSELWEAEMIPELGSNECAHELHPDCVR